MCEIAEYPIVYKPSFVLFWGVALGLSVFTGGSLMFAFTAIAILMLIHHEHAHVKECLKRGVRVNSVTFNWLGGVVNADICYANDAVPILLAGIKNTGYYVFLSIGLLLSVHYMGRNVWSGFNFANNPYLQFLNSFVLFSVILLITNCLPISHYSKKHGVISTDGWGAYRMLEKRDELWNDGKGNAHQYLE